VICDLWGNGKSYDLAICRDNSVYRIIFNGTTINEEHAMRNLIIDGDAGGETKRRHDVTFPLFTLHRGKDRVHFCTGFFKKENIVYTGVLQIFHM
jgi:hypothetical protein